METWTLGDLINIIRADMYRYNRQTGFLCLFKCARENPGFKFTCWLRICIYLVNRPIFKYFFYYWAKMVFDHYKYKFGIDMPISQKIGKGLYVGHFGGIVVGKDVTIGKNCNLSHGVTIGQVNRGRKKVSPIIGDNVYIGVGAKVLGKITIGNNVAIGANCVVIKDIPDKAVVVGVPGKIISYKGSEGYVNNTDY